MGWDNKGKMHGANYNWHKDNPKVLGSSCMNKFCTCRSQLYFAGGESQPSIEEHYTLLEEASKRGYAKQIELRYIPKWY